MHKELKNLMVGTLGEGSFMVCKVIRINAGEGGIVLTNNKNVYNRLIYLSHLNRKTTDDENKFTFKSRVYWQRKNDPLGAITALSDIKNLDKRNKIIREKIKVIYKNLKIKKLICPQS